MHLLLIHNGDERAGLPNASEYSRLLACRASYLLSRKARELGQVAHEYSPAADLGTRKHLASTEGPEILSDREREDWETVQAKREEFIKGWLGMTSDSLRIAFGYVSSKNQSVANSKPNPKPIQGNSQESFSSVKEERLWLRRGIRPLLTGKPDEVFGSG